MSSASDEPAPASIGSAFVAELTAAAHAAEAQEDAFRREAAARIGTLERARTYAYRRAALLRAVAGVVDQAETADAARIAATAELFDSLGWDTTSPARDEVAARFIAVADALIGPQAMADPDSPADPAAALAHFELWYEQTRGSPFWHLYGHYMPETPRVDF